MLKLKQDCERMVKLLWVLGSLAYQFPGFPFFWFIGLPDTWVSPWFLKTKVLVARLILVPRFPQV